MNTLSRTDLRMLLEVSQGPCVSIYMPTHRGGMDVRQDPIRFKNLLRSAQDMLVERGMRTCEAAEFLAAAETLVSDGSVWRNQQEGLAVLVGQEVFRAYDLPVTVEQLVLVSDHFHLKPLLPVLSGDGTFYLLALSQNRSRLYQCSRHSVFEVNLGNTPTSLAEVMRVEVNERSLQFHTGAQPGHGGKRAAMYHSQGVGTDDAVKKRKVEYFITLLETGVRKALNGNEMPLMLAGVDHLRAMYREHNSYPHLVAEGLTGNMDLVSREQLRDRAWPVVEKYFHTARDKATVFYRHLIETDRSKAASRMDDVIVAAYEGRVDRLFVDVAAHKWGRYLPERRALDVHAQPGPGDEDLLDLAAYLTLRNGGTVYAVDNAHLPADAPLAAILRH